ncbi:MAG: Tat pathway signal protein [Candidatus Eisenbacteria bacterium]|uniref:Tat pathway signal protein n=1 Tax=Eiseniibacteriota bacterium TaxID=2212470 RepID=A0A849SG62_UNCEI|nr:Tat pathway signal protein [Candidatus Eisenbacteria bacterium]
MTVWSAGCAGIFARRWALLVALVVALPIGSCREAQVRSQASALGLSEPRVEAFVDSLQRHSFLYFWELGDTTRGLTPDRYPTPSFASTGAMGFALTSYPIGAERGWVTRAAAARRVLATLRFLWTAPHDSSASATGYRGFYYHFLEPGTGRRFEQVELSTVDSGLLLGGALFCQSYFDQGDAAEVEIRALAESLYRRVDWKWAQVRPPTIALAWSPEEGFIPYDWRGYNEAMIMMILALGSPTHPVEPEAWQAWTQNYQWGTFEGHEHLGFPPLFGHQYSHIWVDFRGIADSYMRAKGIDYFENSRRATLAQRDYAIRNPNGWKDYGAEVWGLSACDGPVDTTLMLLGKSRKLRTYSARGAAFFHVEDDGTLAPTAAAGSIAFAPEVVIPSLMAMREKYGAPLYGRYGFLDAFNPSLDQPIRLQHGQVVPGVGWFDTDWLGIDEGPIVCMIENLRSELVWKHMRTNPHLIRGLRRAGFTGGWLDRAPSAP